MTFRTKFESRFEYSDNFRQSSLRLFALYTVIDRFRCRAFSVRMNVVWHPIYVNVENWIYDVDFEVSRDQGHVGEFN